MKFSSFRNSDNWNMFYKPFSASVLKIASYDLKTAKGEKFYLQIHNEANVRRIYILLGFPKN